MKKTNDGSLREGSIVIITEKVSDRVRSSDSEIVIGTLIKIEGGQAWVLLSNTNIWVGESWKVYSYEVTNEQSTDLREESNS